MEHIILVGFMGAGKTTLGQALARELGIRFVDTDLLIEEQQGTTINEIFAVHGEPYFRDLETAVLEALLGGRTDAKELVEPRWRPKEAERRCPEDGEARERLVIAVGGGLPVRPENRRLLKELGTVIYLRAQIDTLVGRLAGDTTRPKLQGGSMREKIASLMAARADIYEETAALVYNTDGKTLEEAVKEIEAYVL